MSDEKQISIEEDGQALSQATVSAPDENHEAWAQVHMASGQLPAGTRQKMADAIHDAVNEDKAQRLTAAVPRGDTELVEGICEHLSGVELRAAGASSIIEGDVKPEA